MASAPADGLLLGHFKHMYGRLDEVLQHGHMRPEIETLEHHGKMGADTLHLPGFCRDAIATPIQAHADGFTVNRDGAGVGDFQEIDAAQQSAFA